MAAKLYFEDFKAGDTAEYGDMLVTVEDIKEFATQFDPQPMHLDEEAAKQTMVGGLCASGWHTCVMMMRIVAVFPAPFGRRKPRISPDSARNDTSSTAFTRPYCLDRC